MIVEERYYVAIPFEYSGKYQNNRRERGETLRDVLTPGIPGYFAVDRLGLGPLESQMYGSELDLAMQKRDRVAREFGIPDGVLKIVHESVQAVVID